jgi:hypothetical protein
MENLTLLTHTHHDCIDVLEIYIDSYKNFFNMKNHYLLINDTYENIFFNNIIYYQNLKYSERLILALNKIKTDYVLISHEDMILIGNVDINNINKCINILKDNKIPYIRLIKSGINNISEKLIDKIFKINNSDFLFSITPTIWDRNILLKILNENLNNNVWELETTCDKYCRDNNIYGVYYYQNEKLRGLNHYDSNIYPHICSAILKGKWNISEYKYEIESIIEKYNININKRGTI